MKFKVCNDVVEAVEASEGRQALAGDNRDLLGAVIGFGVSSRWNGGRGPERDRGEVSRRVGPGRWSGATPNPTLAEAVERALGPLGR